MKFLGFKTAGMAATVLAASVTAVSAQDTLDRTSLPILAPERPTYKELDVRNVEAPPLFKVEAPENAPNVVIIMIDD